MSASIRVVGTYLSPYVRKVLACLELKGLAYEIDPIPPFHGDERFTALSPLRRVPVLADDRVVLCDSTVICEYLEDRYPGPPLLPADAAERARARWLEEYADTRLADVLVWGLFNKAVLAPGLWGEPRDLAELERIRREDVPPVLDYLEAQLPRDGFLFGRLSLADVAIAAPFRNAAFARYRVDAERWPVTAAFVDRVLGQDCLTRLQRWEDLAIRTPVARQREVLAAAGAPLTAETCFTATPRRGLRRL